MPCRQDGWLDVTLHYTGGRQKRKPSEDEEELALAKRFSGDSVDELTHVRCFSKSQTPVKAATASPDGNLLRRYRFSSVWQSASLPWNDARYAGPGVAPCMEQK